MNRHAEDEIGSVGGAGGILDRRLGVERESDAQAERSRMPDGAGRLVARLDVERDAVAAGFRDRLEVLLRLAHHEMAVEFCAPAACQRRYRCGHDRPDRDLGDEVSVAYVEVEDLGTCGPQRAELLAESREVGGVDRRLDLDRICPVGPAHATQARGLC